MWQLLAIVIWLYIMFYWLAFMGTIWCWLNFLFCLLRGQFIRAGFWFATGGWMLMWWFNDTEGHPHQDLGWDQFVPWALTWMAIGGVLTGLLWLGKRKYYQMQAQAEAEAPVLEAPPVHFTMNVEPQPKRRRRKKLPEVVLVDRGDGTFVPQNGEW